MSHYPKPMSRLIKELAKLPGIGPKTAQRLAFHLFALPRDEVVGLATAMVEAKRSLKYCDICGHLTDESPCRSAKTPTRDRHLLCVVEEPKDVIALEKTREFKGLYHVSPRCAIALGRGWPRRTDHIKELLNDYRRKRLTK